MYRGQQIARENIDWEAPKLTAIFIDDMGYGDIGPFGSTKNRTPELDRMANEGMRFTSFYAAPLCSVSRAQVITGCYGQRVSLPGVLFPDRNGIHAEEHTVAELLKAQGYVAMCIGKWHLGDQPEFLPTRHGFDHYFGIPYSNDMQTRRWSSGSRLWLRRWLPTWATESPARASGLPGRWNTRLC